MSLLLYLTVVSLCATAFLGLYEHRYWNETSELRVRYAKLKRPFKIPIHYYLFATLAIVSLVLVSLCLIIFLLSNSPLLLSLF